MGLFVLLLVFQTVVLEVVLRRLAAPAGAPAVHSLGQPAFWSGLISPALAPPLAAWVASRVTGRLQRVVDFARKIAEGDLDARLDPASGDELMAMEAPLNITADRLGMGFAQHGRR